MVVLRPTLLLPSPSLPRTMVLRSPSSLQSLCPLLSLSPLRQWCSVPLRPCRVRMEEDGEIYDGVRAQFPLSFGKQTKSQTSLEEIHNATRRTSNSNSKTTNDFPSLSSSSKEWLKSLRPSRNPTPPPPQPDEEDDGPLVGPPPPPSGLGPENHDDEEMIGPPPPPPRDYNLEDDSDQTELGNRFRIPLSNEIVLKGHTKVRFSCSTRMGFSLTPHLRIDEEFGKESQDRGGGGEGYPSSHPHLSVMPLRSDGSLCVADSFRHFAAPEGFNNREFVCKSGVFC